MAEDGKPTWGWWSIHGKELMKLLRRCHAGEEPDMVYAEAYANSEIEHVEPTDEDKA